MKQLLGYFLGFAIFIAGIPALMWWVSGMPTLAGIPSWRFIPACLIALTGLSLSVWSIIYMKRIGKGNPFDAMGHEVAPRTQHLMTDGPYRRSRNPMLSGTYLYYLGGAGRVVAMAGAAGGSRRRGAHDPAGALRREAP